jgi:SAM-dependent methyltransferase
MKILKKPVNAKSRQGFRDWYGMTPSGRILQSIEAAYLQNYVQLTYRQTILQVGVLGTEHIFIAEDFKNQFFTLSLDSDNRFSRGIALRGDVHALPVATGSIDLLLLPHVLEFVNDPHAALREVERVLKPEGQLFVLCFNPLSIRALLQSTLSRDSFGSFRLIPPYRVLDWMSLLNLDARYHAGFSTATAEVIVSPRTWFQHSRAYLSMAYAVRAIKRTYTVIPIQPSWVPAQGLLAGQIAETSVTHQPRRAV